MLSSSLPVTTDSSVYRHKKSAGKKTPATFGKAWENSQACAVVFQVKNKKVSLMLNPEMVSSYFLHAHRHKAVFQQRDRGTSLMK
jgi:hypothetical protein